MKLSVLLYGGPGVGKTYLATSAFFDHKERKLMRKGVVVRIGRESNPALALPEECIISVPMNLTDVSAFGKALAIALRKVLKLAREGLDVVVVDSFSEWSSVLQLAMPEEGSARMRAWGDLKREFIYLMQALHPDELGAHVIGTARIAEFRKPIVTKTGEGGGDPEWMSDYRYFPAIDGWGRRNLPHYFNLMLYLDTDVQSVAGGRRTVHKVYLLSRGDYWVKNVYEHLWRGLPTVLVNPTFDDILAVVEKAMKGGENEQRQHQ